MIAPSLFEVGATKLKDTSPNVFVIAEKLVRTVVIRVTVRVAVMVPDAKIAVLAWPAVMVEVPTPTMVTVLPSIVATSGSELV